MAIKKLGIVTLSFLLAFSFGPLAYSQQPDMPQKDGEAQKAPQQQQQQQQQQQRQPGAQAQSQSQQQVRQVQTALRDEGFNPGPIDGLMGPLTEKALREYQNDNGLEASGKIDQATLSALGVAGALQPRAEGEQQPSAGQQREGLYPPAEEGQTPGQRSQTQPGQAQPGQSQQGQAQPGQARPGQTQPGQAQQGQPQPGQAAQLSTQQVDQVRSALRERGFNPGTGNVDSAQMKEAIRQFQQQNQLPATGMLDSMTLQALNVRLDGPQAPQQPRQGTPTTTGPQTGRPAVAQVEVDKDIQERITKATTALTEISADPEKGISPALLEQAVAVAVIPGMARGGIGIGGQYGRGLMSQRTTGGQWGAPVFVGVGGTGVSAQIGAESTDLVLVFTDIDAVRMLKEGQELKLGKDVTVAAGPVGRTARPEKDADVYSYSRSGGLFAGATMDEAVLEVDSEINEKVYGKNVTAQQILTDATKMNTAVQPFTEALQKISPVQRRTSR